MHKFLSGVRSGFVFVVGRLLMVCLALVAMTVPAMAQTTGATFPDIANVIPIDQIGTKVTTFLVTALGIVIAIKLGIVLGKKMLKWFGAGV